ncbi:tryptophan--tRNA ligase [Bdellovibrio sp. GT3]|uniref:tryptophan--tRNA ligase n=1 Tax=Bdellovibrio sp. GT3 TaxID=3136282 RepID=UPI0030F10D88
MKKIILTGDRPTGPLHLGHYVGSLQNRVKLQEEYNQYVLIADAQALTDYYENPEHVRKNVEQVALDYLAVGIDPKQSTIFIQSQVPELFELTFYFMNLVTVARLERNPTLKDEIRQKNMKDSIPAGFFTYPVSQAADILAFKADLVPVGEDQQPMIEQTNEIARRFNHLYKKEVFHDTKAMVGTTGRLTGIDGKTKMSKSLGNAIYLGDTPNELKKKVNAMYTDPNHLKVEDPGTVEGHVPFTFLDVFDTNKAEVEALKEHYRRGGLGDGVLKKRILEILEAKLAPMRQRREEYSKDMGYVQEVLRNGTEAARNVAAKTLSDVKKAMGIVY